MNWTGVRFRLTRRGTLRLGLHFEQTEGRQQMKAPGWVGQWDQMVELQAGRIRQSDHSDERGECRDGRAKRCAPPLRIHTEIKAFGCILMLFMYHAVHADVVIMENATEQHDGNGILSQT